MFRFVSLISAALAAEVQEDALSLLQLRAEKPHHSPRRAARSLMQHQHQQLHRGHRHQGDSADIHNVAADLLPAEEQAAEGNGFCGLGILTEVDDGATLGTLVAKFEARCEEAKDPDSGLELYSTVLCEQLRQELAEGLDLDEPANSGGDGPQKLCAELRRLTQAHFDHESDDVDQAVQRKEAVTPCVADVDCNGHGATADNDSKDGCVCDCLDGWSGSDCSQEPEEVTTTQDAGKAIDDPHLTSIHGTHFDLYDSGKYTLLSVPRHASASDADLLVTAYVEKIGERKNDLWIRRMSVSGKWVGENYSFKTSSGSFGSEGTRLVRIGHSDWLSPEAAQAAYPANLEFRVLSHKKHHAPTKDFSQSLSDRVELQCGPVTALIRWATVQKNGEDVNHIDFRMSGLHDLDQDVGGLLVDEFDAE